MWPSLTGNQNEAEAAIEGTETLNSSIAISIGIIGRKNLRADAPVFKTSNSEISHPTSYEAISGDLTGSTDHENFYSQDTAVDFQPMYGEMYINCNYVMQSS